MRVSVDQGICGGHGDCIMAAPQVFDFVGDDEVVSVLVAELPERLHEVVLTARDVCPTQAISIQE